jgi:adenosylcobinamide-phosphate synthase
MSSYLLPAAFILDLIVGDPVFLPHPIRLMGKAIERLENWFRSRIINETRAGIWFAIILIAATWAAAWGIIRLALVLSPALGWAVQLVLLYYCLSTRSLYEAGMGIYRSICLNGVDAAKSPLAMVVGRDVAPLTRNGVIRAAVETVAENLVDGVIAPMFFALVGGVPLALTYKMINTLDSMVGYKNDRYRDFGWFSARIDDLANFFPARLSVPIVAASAQLLNRSGKTALATALMEGRHHASPNAGYPEAAFAGALRIKLNGPSFYRGRMVPKPYIGKDFASPRAIHIKRSCSLMVVSSVLCLSCFWLGSLLAAFL